MSKGNPTPPKRGRCGGWNQATVRRNTAWLYSVDTDQLDGMGFGLTFTLVMCPETHDQWAAMRRALVERLRRLGFLRLFWLTEWQTRGVPHLHLAVYFPDLEDDADVQEFAGKLKQAWLDIAYPYGAQPQGQFVEYIYDPVGWSKYLSRHASRGARHYQRCPENMPAKWRGVTGRMWGYTGDWPTSDPSDLEMTREAWFAMRRMVRNWRKADARAKGDPKRIVQARRMLQCSDPKQARVRGWSEWIPEGMTMRMLSSVAARGYPVYS